ADGLAHDEVLHVARGPDGRLWIATRGGVSCLDGAEFTSLTAEDGLPADAVKHLTVDSRGRVWGATLGAGVFQFDGKNVQTLTEDDGLPSNYCPGVVEDVDGAILIATLRGIARYAPGARRPPSVRIVGLDTHEWHDAPASVTTQAGFGRVRVVYRGVSLMTTRMRYAYMLEGVDDTWTSTWAEEVVYANLPEGDYVLKITAFNRDLVEAVSPAELAIHVVPDPRDEAVAELDRVIGERTEQLALAETEIQRQADLLAQIVRDAKCILWHSHVEAVEDLYHWTPLRPAAPEFHDILPLDSRPGEDYHTAWERSVFPEDRQVMDVAGNDAIRDGLPGYSHDYRCTDRYGVVRWLHEDATIRRIADTRWTVTGVVTDITALKEAERDQLARKERDSTEAALRTSEQERSQLIVQMMTVQENERARIARDLHDHAGQALSSLLVGLKVLSQIGDVSEVRRQAEALREVATETFHQVRELSFDVYPSALEHLGLVAALQQDAALFQSRHGTTVHVHADAEPAACPRPVKAAVYQVVHAALANIAHHAGASAVGIVVQQHGDRLSVIVEDDGAGFDVEAVLSGPVDHRFGLLAMQERMRSIDGKVSFESTPGEGTSLFIEARPEAAPLL
ncbi:PAS domain-containing protein, partial [Candidatus Poribacteria bacterium]|nr:PAS domain-containing protein [Candidatus Poribacteria bacterium]